MKKTFNPDGDLRSTSGQVKTSRRAYGKRVYQCQHCGAEVLFQYGCQLCTRTGRGRSKHHEEDDSDER